MLLAQSGLPTALTMNSAMHVPHMTVTTATQLDFALTAALLTTDSLTLLPTDAFQKAGTMMMEVILLHLLAFLLV